MNNTEFYNYASTLNVLYAEDSATMRHATEKILLNYFPRLQSASDGAEAFDHYRSFNLQNNKTYDIVITDLEMPNMGGEELVRLILEINPSQSIIVISSNDNFQQLIRLMNMGVKKFLTKPINKDNLHEVLQNVVEVELEKEIQANELIKVSKHNALLKKREEVYLTKLEKNLKILSEFNDALNESGIVSKTDVNGMITYVNDKFCSLSGYSSDELIGKPHNIVKSGEHPSNFYETMWLAIAQGKSFKGLIKNRAKDGSFYYVDNLIKPILNTQGEVIEFISIAHDMTPLMNALESEQKFQKQKDEFFNNISHEMRTPLNAILGLTSLLKRRMKDNPKLLNMVHVIEQSSNNLHQLIESILDIQKIQQGEFELVEISFDLHPMLKKLSEQYRQKSFEKKQHFTVSLDPALPKILFGDSKRLSQAITTVLDNATKFTPKGGHIDFNVSFEEPNLICQVQDDGIGIAKENQSKIFEFTQLDGSVTRKHEGAGLGLVLAHNIIQKMGGSITVHSQPGEGSTFLLEIPFQQVI